jgi:hypothetical protein
MLTSQEHNHYLNTLKRLLNASFVGWVNEKDKKYLKITVNKKDINLPFEGGELISEKSYLDLIKNILKIYGYDDGQIQEPTSVDVADGGVEELPS